MLLHLGLTKDMTTTPTINAVNADDGRLSSEIKIGGDVDSLPVSFAPAPTPAVMSSVEQNESYSVAYFERLVMQHRPVLQLHKREIYNPCTIEYYASHSSLYKGTQLICEDGTFTADDLGSLDWLQEMVERASKNPPPTQNDGRIPRNKTKFNLRLNPKFRAGFSWNEVNSVPYYAKVATSDTDNLWHIIYIFVYAYNPPTNVFGWQVGDHDCDFEHMTIRVHKRSNQVHSVFFGAHGYVDGAWAYPPSSKHKPHYECTISNRVVAYVALGGHGLYAHSGTHRRIFNFANDVTGFFPNKRWEPDRVVLLECPCPSHVPPLFHNYKDNWEYDGIDSIREQRWYKDGDPHTSTRWIRRLFYLGLRSTEHWCLELQSSQLDSAAFDDDANLDGDQKQE